MPAAPVLHFFTTPQLYLFIQAYFCTPIPHRPPKIIHVAPISHFFLSHSSPAAQIQSLAFSILLWPPKFLSGCPTVASALWHFLFCKLPFLSSCQRASSAQLSKIIQELPNPFYTPPHSSPSVAVGGFLFYITGRYPSPTASVYLRPSPCWSHCHCASNRSTV